MKKNFQDIVIVDAIADNVYDVREVQRVTWLATYPNEEAGITTSDIESFFANDATPEGKARIEKRREAYSDPNRHIWVAKDNDRIVGFYIATKESKNGRIQAIYVVPEYQGRGIGKKFIKTGFDWLDSDTDIYVNVAAYNAKSIGFYESCGFIKTGRDATDAVGKLPSGKIIPEIEMVKRQ